jgi:diacylglycerol kinase family enzyme
MAAKLRETALVDAPAARRTAALVLNEKAGALLAAGGGQQLRDRVVAAGLELVPLADGPLPALVAQADASDADVIVVAGGDGSIACAAEILAGTGRLLGLIPSGTMNLLAKDLGIPVDDPEAAIALLADGTARHIDVGDIGGHVFLCAAMLGSPARIGHHREDGRRRGNGFFGWLHVGRALLRALRRHRALRMTVTVDGRPYKLRTPSLTITVNALDEATGRAFGRARLDGGSLFLYAVQHHSLGGLLRILFNAARGRLGSDPNVRVLHGRDVTIAGTGAALRVLIDGEEHLLPTPLRARIRPGALSIIGAA